MNRTTRRVLTAAVGIGLFVGAAPIADAGLCNGLCATATRPISNTGIRPVDEAVERVGQELENVDHAVNVEPSTGVIRSIGRAIDSAEGVLPRHDAAVPVAPVLDGAGGATEVRATDAVRTAGG